MKLGLKKQRNKPINPYQKQWNNEDIEFPDDTTEDDLMSLDLDDLADSIDFEL